MRSTLLQHIGQKKKPLNRSLTIEYWKNRLNKFLLGLLEDMLDTVVEKLIFTLDDTASTLMQVYKEAEQASVDEARQAYPAIQELRKVITKQKKQYAKIDYADSEEVKEKFHQLVHLINRLEARIHQQMHQDNEPAAAPSYMKAKMKDNSRKAVTDALR